jgi:hypothetical protein
LSDFGLRLLRNYNLLRRIGLAKRSRREMGFDVAFVVTKQKPRLIVELHVGGCSPVNSLLAMPTASMFSGTSIKWKR